jgi:hypothetical protein
VNTWTAADGRRMFLTREQSYVQQVATNGTISYQSLLGLALLRQIPSEQGLAAELLDAKTFTGLSLSALAREGNKLILTGQPYYYYYSSSTVQSWEATSARLLLLDMSQNRLDVSYDQPTKAASLTVMGTQKNRAFLNLPGDGIVVVDTSNPTAPIGVTFLRTLGYATHLESFGDDVYVASGFFGIDHLSLLDPPNI